MSGVGEPCGKAGVGRDGAAPLHRQEAVPLPAERGGPRAVR